MTRKISSTLARKTAGDLVKKMGKELPDNLPIRNAWMCDAINVLSTYAPVITIGNKEELPVISSYIHNTLKILGDYDLFKHVAFKDKEYDIVLIKDQSVCDQYKDSPPVPPRWGKGEMSPRLQAIIHQATLQSLAKARNLQSFAISLNIPKKLEEKALVEDNPANYIAGKLRYRFDTMLGYMPEYFYLRAEFTWGKREKRYRLHFHGGILLHSLDDVETAIQCFKKVSPEDRSIVLEPVLDMLSYYPIRWGQYTAKAARMTAKKITHQVYSTEKLSDESREYYNVLRELFIQHAEETAPAPESSLKSLHNNAHGLSSNTQVSQFDPLTVSDEELDAALAEIEGSTINKQTDSSHTESFTDEEIDAALAEIEAEDDELSTMVDWITGDGPDPSLPPPADNNS